MEFCRMRNIRVMDEVELLAVMAAADPTGQEWICELALGEYGLPRDQGSTTSKSENTAKSAPL